MSDIGLDLHDGGLDSSAPSSENKKPSCRWQTMPKIVPIRRAYNVVDDNTGLFSFV